MTRSNSDRMPFVSIVVLMYNSESMIKKCLDSIMALKYPREKLEVIVVDDTSTDKTRELIKNYSIQLVRKEHGGYPSTMNTGIRVCKEASSNLEVSA